MEICRQIASGSFDPFVHDLEDPYRVIRPRDPWIEAAVRYLRWTAARVIIPERRENLSLPPSDPQRPLVLYVHVPFCQALCAYCSFHRFPFQEDVARRYFATLREELVLLREQGYAFHSLYVGGGTPTILPDELLRLIAHARELFPLREVSVEGDPPALDPAILREMRGLVDRLSVGIQTFDDDLLFRAGRLHKFGTSDALQRRIAASVGILPFLSIDLIFNWPEQTPAMLCRDLEILLGLGPEQITTYPLMVSSATRSRNKRLLGNVSSAREAVYYKVIRRTLEPAYTPTTAWHFARGGGRRDEPIDEYVVDYPEYVGAGSGAFSFRGDALYVNAYDLEEYERLVRAGRNPVTHTVRFSRRHRYLYELMVELFSRRISEARFSRIFGVPVEKALSRELTLLEKIGALRRAEDGWTVTPRGEYLALALMREFYIAMDNVRERLRAELGAKR
ncbi:MAG: putative Oxygen-independent coproporphyrinogen III oxidase [Brockia lithotrophica]|uniref:Heme chaperone HemW n=1 Tax=Brockia lithotrophica TaxID=933949 RepID=A0A2T5G560_9BACL|nr:MAG: putative Oxygen-independent coproporphyrinogen III oxidase [Brockia lithotrophica]